VASALGAVGSIFGAASSAKAANDQAKAQKRAAELQTQVARELHAHWQAYYAPCDITAIQEVCAEPYVTPNYALVLNRTNGEATRNFTRAKSQVGYDSSVLCLADVCQSCNYLSSIEALTTADVVNFGYRWEEQFAFQRNQIVLENRMTHLAMGRNLIDQQNAATRLAAEIAARVGAMAGKSAQNWATLGSYLLSDRGQKQVNDTISLFKRGFGVTEREKSIPAAFGTDDTKMNIMPEGTQAGVADTANRDALEAGDWWMNSETQEG
jgi:hypothetical protein